MQQELSKDLEEYLVSRYACIRHKFETALKDPNEYKNIPHLSFSLLAMLKNVQKAKPHAEYLIESLESADLKFRAINFLLKGQNDNKKETARLSIKSTLNGDEYFKDKLERMKNKSVGGLKKPLLSNAGTGENAQDLTRNKPYLRTYKDYEEGGNNNSEYQFANKKPKLNSEDGYSYGKRDYDNKASTTETSELPGFTSAKDQFVKNQQQKKKYNDYEDNEYSNRPYYKNNKGYNNYNKGYSKYKNDMEGDDSYQGGYKGKSYQRKVNYGYGNEMEEETGPSYRNYKPYNKFNNKESRDDGGQADSSLMEKIHFSAFRKNLSSDVGSNLKGNSEENSSLGPSKGLGGGLRKKFVPPLKENQNQGNSSLNKQTSNDEKMQDERYKGLDPKLVEMIENDIVDRSPKILWADIAGLQFAKKTIYEIIVWPMMRPDLFSGLRAPPKVNLKN